MNKGTIVYLAWYDFRQQTEHVCRGEIVDNSIWADTQYKKQHRTFCAVLFSWKALSDGVE